MSNDKILLSTPDGVTLQVGVHEAPGGRPAVVLLHGIASHMGWYRGLGEALSERGISVYLPDRRGSGISEGERGHAEDWTTLVDDARQVCDEVRRRTPDAPITLLGISLGGLFASALAIRHPKACDGLILSAPALATAVKVPLPRRLRVLRRSFTHPTRLYDLPFGPAQIVHRPDWLRVLEGDPLRTRQVSARFLTSMFKCQKFVARQFARIQVPSYCMLGGDDQVIDNVGVRRIVGQSHDAARWIETFEEAPHVIPSALPRDALLDRLDHWARGAERAQQTPRRTIETKLGSADGEELMPPPIIDGTSP